MKSFIAALRSLVLPYGVTSGARIVLDGVNGLITLYNASETSEMILDPGGTGIPTIYLDRNGSRSFLNSPVPGMAEMSSADGTTHRFLSAVGTDYGALESRRVSDDVRDGGLIYVTDDLAAVTTVSAASKVSGLQAAPTTCYVWPSLDVEDITGAGWGPVECGDVTAHGDVTATGVIGAQSTFTPAWYGNGGANNPTNYTSAGTYFKLGKLVIAHASFTPGASFTAGAGTYLFQLPLQASTGLGLEDAMGTGLSRDSSAPARYAHTAMCRTTGGSELYLMYGSTTVAPMSATTPFVPANGDTITYNVIYYTD